MWLCQRFSYNQWQVALQEPTLIQVFDALEISADDAWALFTQLDSDSRPQGQLGTRAQTDLDLLCDNRTPNADVHLVAERIPKPK